MEAFALLCQTDPNLDCVGPPIKIGTSCGKAQKECVDSRVMYPDAVSKWTPLHSAIRLVLEPMFILVLEGKGDSEKLICIWENSLCLTIKLICKLIV